MRIAAFVGRDQSGDHVEDGGLARPVRPEQSDGLAAGDFEAHAADHDALLEGLDHGMDGEPPGIGVRLGILLVAMLLGLGNPALGGRLAAWER